MCRGSRELPLKQRLLSVIVGGNALVFYPRNGASVFDGEGEWPSLSEKGAVELK